MNTITKERNDSASKDEQDLSRLVAFASGVGLGAMLALSEALRVNDTSAFLQFSFRTAIAFAMGFVAAYAYLSRILRYPEGTSRLFFRIGLAILLVLVGLAFGYPLRLFAIRTLITKLVGVAAALCFIGAGLTLVRCVVRSAESEEAIQEAKEASGPTPAP
jgi:hypothetical protein